MNSQAAGSGFRPRSFKRLGIEGDFENPYTTMNFHAESTHRRRADEDRQVRSALSRLQAGHVVGRRAYALAEAEVEYADVRKRYDLGGKFRLTEGPDALAGAFVVIWTTTPWTIPGNARSPIRRAMPMDSISRDRRERLRPAAGREAESSPSAWRKSRRPRRRSPSTSCAMWRRPIWPPITCAHPLTAWVALCVQRPASRRSSTVTDDAGTGFVHTAPSHGREDFEAWMDNVRVLEGTPASRPRSRSRSIDAGYFTGRRPRLSVRMRKRRRPRHKTKGQEGTPTTASSRALIGRHALFARGRLKHSYPHSWRS